MFENFVMYAFLHVILFSWLKVDQKKCDSGIAYVEAVAR